MPAMRPALICFCSNPTHPKWSTARDESACPATITEIKAAAPSLGAAKIDPAT